MSANATAFGLLALAALINFVDRANLATAGPVLRDELGLTNAEFGILLGAFFWTYTPAQPFAGYLVERFSIRWVLAAGVAVWSLATVASGLVSTFAALLAFRLLLGLGESVMYPAAIHMLAVHATERQRATASGLLSAGNAFGPAIATFGGGLLIAAFGWRAPFLVLGILSLLWIWPWLIATRRLQQPAPTGAHTRAPNRELLACRALWGMSLGHFANNYALYFVLSWLPTYLVKSEGFTVTNMAGVGAAIYLVYACTSVGTGLIADRLVRRGIDAAVLLHRLLIGSVACLALFLALAAGSSGTFAVLALAACGACFGIQSTSILTSVQILAGPRAAGRWMGIQNLFANLAGIFGPVITGWLVDRTGSFTPAFMLAAGACAAGVFAYMILVPQIAPVTWANSEASAQVAAEAT